MKMIFQGVVFSLLIISAVSVANKPNIIFILTDDQDFILGGLSPMRMTKNLIEKQGVIFNNTFATTPICCPSRSSFLTGLYIHSHGTVNNSVSGGCSSSNWQSQYEPRTYGKILHDAGYKTFYAGKYLNQYGYKHTGGTEHVPPGWDWWVGLVGNSVYYNYTLSVNGIGVKYGDKPDDYLTDVLKDYSLSFLRNLGDESFLMAINTPSAHAPFTPAERHRGVFSDVGAPRTENFNIPVNNTKHWLLRLPPSVLPQETIDNIDEVYRNRWETLLAVDELVEKVVLELEVQGKLSNTYIVFSSDHGFHFGQFGQTWDKRQPYESDIRIPLLVRGPGIVPGSIVSDPVLNIDFAATFFDIAGIKVTTDGVSFLSALNNVPAGSYSRAFFVEYRGEGTVDGDSNLCYDDLNLTLCALESSCKCFDARNNTFFCLRELSDTANTIHCVFEDDEQFEELYDINEDPYQMRNLAPNKNGRRKLNRCRESAKTGRTVDECFNKVL